MTKERQQILDMISLPRNAETFDGKLTVLADAFSTLRNDSGGKLTLKGQDDYSAICDLMLYRERLAKESRSDDLPDTDPLTMIESGERYQVFSKAQAADLKAEFMRKVNAIAGAGVTPAQAKKLFRLFTDYNPLAKVDFLNGP